MNVKDFIKKQSVGIWISLATVVLALASLITYGVTLATGDGVLPEAQAGAPIIEAAYFGGITAIGVLGLIFTVLAIVGAQFDFEELLGKSNNILGIVGKICNLIVDALRVVAPALFMLMIITMVNATYNGIAWSLFSNEELYIEPVAVKAAYLIIVTAVMLLITSIVGMVAAFFGLKKKEKKEAVVEAEAEVKTEAEAE